MNTRQLALTAFGVAVVVAGAAWVVAQLLPAPDQVGVVAESTPSTTQAGPATSARPAQPAPTATAAPDEAESDTRTPRAATEADPGTGPGTAADATPRTSTEVLPGEPEPIILPPSMPRAALVSLPLPDTASSLGEVVDGFPSDVLPGIPDSLVDTSSVAAQGERLQAALDAKTTLGTVDVLAFYRQHFAPLGLLETPETTTGRSSTLSFARGQDSVTLSVTAVAGGSRYVLFGAFTAKG